MITIFTPTYNRAHLLPHLFESLQNQESHNFEWLIVDDGSIDNTHKLIEDFKKQAKFTIHYIYQENQGKHVAYNTALDHFSTEYFMTVDSDDKLLPNLLKKITHYILNPNTHIIAYAFPLVDFKGKLLISKSFNKILIRRPLEMLSQDKITGEFTLIFKTALAKNFRYPVFPGEKFMRESLVYNRMANKYKFMYIPESLVEAEYREDGLTNNIKKALINSPQGAALAYKEIMNNKDVPMENRKEASLSFWDYATVSKQNFLHKLLQIDGLKMKLIFLERKFIKFSK